MPDPHRSLLLPEGCKVGTATVISDLIVKVLYTITSQLPVILLTKSYLGGIAMRTLGRLEERVNNTYAENFHKTKGRNE
jgi:hypothetical protein